MLTKRIIPCLDIKDGRTVKGTQFINLRDAGDPVELAMRYCDEGADELVFLDITATVEKRKALCVLVKKIAACINIPYTVGGGIRSMEDVKMLLDAGADKVAVNSAAFHYPYLIEDIAGEFGSQCLVLAIDTRKEGDGKWYVYTEGGRHLSGTTTIDWAISAVQHGAGEILLTSMDHDGVRKGFAIEITRQVSENVSVPVIASGGAGWKGHFRSVLTEGAADAALAASIFHFKEVQIPDLKRYLAKQNIPVRL